MAAAASSSRSAVSREVESRRIEPPHTVIIPKEHGPKQEADRREREYDVDELVRRYNEQLKEIPYEEKSQAHYARTLSQAQQQYGAYVSQYARPTSQAVQTMADEYLDYYMPTKRGPPSTTTSVVPRQPEGTTAMRERNPRYAPYPSPYDSRSVGPSRPRTQVHRHQGSSLSMNDRPAPRVMELPPASYSPPISQYRFPPMNTRARSPTPAEVFRQGMVRPNLLKDVPREQQRMSMSSPLQMERRETTSYLHPIHRETPARGGGNNVSEVIDLVEDDEEKAADAHLKTAVLQNVKSPSATRGCDSPISRSPRSPPVAHDSSKFALADRRQSDEVYTSSSRRPHVETDSKRSSSTVSRDTTVPDAVQRRTVGDPGRTFPQKWWMRPTVVDKNEGRSPKEEKGKEDVSKYPRRTRSSSRPASNTLAAKRSAAEVSTGRTKDKKEESDTEEELPPRAKRRKFGRLELQEEEDCEPETHAASSRGMSPESEEGMESRDSDEDGIAAQAHAHTSRASSPRDRRDKHASTLDVAEHPKAQTPIVKPELNRDDGLTRISKDMAVASALAVHTGSVVPLPVAIVDTAEEDGVERPPRRRAVSAGVRFEKRPVYVGMCRCGGCSCPGRGMAYA